MYRKKHKDFDDDNEEEDDGENGFAAWGGYMEAKKAKLVEQYRKNTVAQADKISSIFKGVAIFVNGLTNPTSDDLKQLMAEHGGVYHMYRMQSTTHVIASNLANVKIKNLGRLPVVKPVWITESISAGRLLDYRKYLLYTNESANQPRLKFESVQELKPAPTKTASNPKFLEEFYNNSRLHLISTLGAEFKQLVNDWRKNSDNKFPGKEKLISKFGRKSNTLNDLIIMHIDMDCFFVSVGLRRCPDLKGKPVAVTHAKNSGKTPANPSRAAEIALYKERLPAGTTTRLDSIDETSSMSEIASCSYEARQCGIKNGMFLGSALKLCPELKTIPYDFEGYREVSATLYRTIASYTLDIEAVSCDEMYVDVTQILRESSLTVEEWATYIRNEITRATGCPCSTGFGANRLQARLATKKAKPNGQFYLRPQEVQEYMSEVLLADLPGVGHATLAKLKNLRFSHCGDVQMASLATLQSELGQKIGEVIFEQAKGIDNKPLNFHHERKSVSAEVNYGIRFKSQDECLNFLHSLSKEVHNRLVDTGRRARCVTLKLMVRAAKAPEETAKYLGHGICDSLSRSTSGPLISDSETIYRETKSLYEKLNVSFSDLRGVGIQLTKLEKTPVVSKALSNFLNNVGTAAKSAKTCVENLGSNYATTSGKVEDIPTSSVNGDNRANEKLVSSVKNEGKASATVAKVKRRGRPPKSAVSKTKRDGEALDKFFKSGKQLSQIETKSSSRPKPEKNAKIDMDVLKELPADLQQEIIEQYGLDSEETIPQSSENEKLLPEIEKPPDPLDKLGWEEMKCMLRQWLRSVDKPVDYDVEMLGNHFKRLAIDCQIETLHVALNYLYRLMSTCNCKSWHGAYRSIINLTQEGMVARYGNTIIANRHFPCCK